MTLILYLVIDLFGFKLLMINMIIPILPPKKKRILTSLNCVVNLEEWSNQESIIILSKKEIRKEKRVLLLGDRSGQLSSKKYRASCVFVL